MKYRKKPVVIEAFKLNARGLVGEDWFWDAVSSNDIITHDFGKFHDDPAWCEIKTLEGTMIARAVSNGSLLFFANPTRKPVLRRFRC